MINSVIFDSNKIITIKLIIRLLIFYWSKTHLMSMGSCLCLKEILIVK
jgi:hypothetical protein